MNNFKKILLVNLLILIGCNLLAHLCTWIISGGGLGFSIILPLFAALHLLVLFVIAIMQFLRGFPESGATFLLCTALILAISFSAYYGGTMLYNDSFKATIVPLSN